MNRKNSSIFFSKKGLAVKTVIEILLFSIVLLFLMFLPSNLGITDRVESGVNDKEIWKIAQKCNSNIGLCNIEVCEVENGCDDKDLQKDWAEYKRYYEICLRQDELNEDQKKLLNCDGKLFSKINLVIDNLEEIDIELDDEQIIKLSNDFKNSPFYQRNKNQFENYANNKKFDENILYAIIVKEGGYDKSFESSVRFECHLFNKVSDEQVKCTINEKVYSKVKSETNFDAFKSASEINYDLAFESSSFGFPQILGSNLKAFSSEKTSKEIFNSLDSESVMIDYFFDFIESRNLIENFQSKDFVSIAKKYNGELYSQNNYDSDIEGIYESLS